MKFLHCWVLTMHTNMYLKHGCTCSRSLVGVEMRESVTEEIKTYLLMGVRIREALLHLTWQSLVPASSLRQSPLSLPHSVSCTPLPVPAWTQTRSPDWLLLASTPYHMNKPRRYERELVKEVNVQSRCHCIFLCPLYCSNLLVMQRMFYQTTHIVQHLLTALSISFCPATFDFLLYLEGEIH